MPSDIFAEISPIFWMVICAALVVTAGINRILAGQEMDIQETNDKACSSSDIEALLALSVVCDSGYIHRQGQHRDRGCRRSDSVGNAPYRG